MYVSMYVKYMQNMHDQVIDIGYGTNACTISMCKIRSVKPKHKNKNKKYK